MGAFLCRGLAEVGYRVAVVDIQSDKAANVAQEINAAFGEGMAYGFGADAHQRAERFWRSLAESMKFLVGLICWSTARASPKRRLSAIFNSAISTARYR
ncbi:sorbitol-6-phosphate dehydrogenase [Citrobacter koseri]|uniref:Sorbitol-6-phosphate dehydrogenase n=1 Tax=Citrobacter koseri TaxID=545 RepID=A0A3S4JPI3_CITKO|nr:sorbitol-6-phosphate dehydrogenase [Citrobacter koseri]